MELVPYKIYVDGSSKGNNAAHRFGGWAFVITYEENVILRGSGAEKGSTNQRMELQAAIEGIKNAQTLTEDRDAAIYEIYSDSAYLVNCWESKWYWSWEANKWHNSRGEDVRNADLWVQLLPYFKNRRYTFLKVKGHADNKHNIEADKAAQQAAEHLRITGVF